MKPTLASHREALQKMESLRKKMSDCYTMTENFQDQRLIALSVELDEMVIAYMKQDKKDKWNLHP